MCWHRADPGKLLVAEKMGLISFYNVENETCIFSTDYGKSLSSCHWSPTDDDIIASIHQGELLVWQLPNKWYVKLVNILESILINCFSVCHYINA